MNVTRRLHKIKEIIDTNLFRSEIIKSKNYPKNSCVFSGIEPDPRGLPIYAISYIYFLKIFYDNKFSVNILFADKHARIVGRPFIIKASKSEIEAVKTLWREIFNFFKVDANFYESLVVSEDAKYKDIFRVLSNVKNKFKYLPKELREYYGNFSSVPLEEWVYLNMELSDVLYINPAVFFSDMPERPLHVALHEKVKKAKKIKRKVEVNFNIPFSFLSPTIPPPSFDCPAPTFYWITDFRNRECFIPIIGEDKRIVKRKIECVFQNKYLVSYIVNYIVSILCDFGFNELIFSEKNVEYWACNLLNVDKQKLKNWIVRTLVKFGDYFQEMLCGDLNVYR